MSKAVCADCGAPLQTASGRRAYCPACVGDGDDGTGDTDTAADSERERTITACPECDCADIYHRPGDNRSEYESHDDLEHGCNRCGHHFDEPIERPARSSHTLTGLAGRLADADPSEVRR